MNSKFQNQSRKEVQNKKLDNLWLQNEYPICSQFGQFCIHCLKPPSYFPDENNKGRKTNNATNKT